jgi:flagellar protein FliO/FliZ
MLELTIRLIVSLAIVVGLLMLLARFGARRFRGQAGAMVRVLHRQPLSRTSSVAVVTVGTRVLVLGTTEHQVSILTELEPEELDLVVEEAPLSDPLTEDLAPEQPQQVRQPVEIGELVDAIEPRDPLAGSVLSPQTWRQAFQVATQAASRAGGRRAS